MKIQIRTASIHDFPAVDAIMRQVQQLHIDWRPDIYRQSATVLPIEVYEQAVRDQTFLSQNMRDAWQVFCLSCTAMSKVPRRSQEM